MLQCVRQLPTPPHTNFYLFSAYTFLTFGILIFALFYFWASLNFYFLFCLFTFGLLYYLSVLLLDCFGSLLFWWNESIIFTISNLSSQPQPGFNSHPGSPTLKQVLLPAKLLNVICTNEFNCMGKTANIHITEYGHFNNYLPVMCRVQHSHRNFKCLVMFLRRIFSLMPRGLRAVKIAVSSLGSRIHHQPLTISGNKEPLKSNLQ